MAPGRSHRKPKKVAARRVLMVRLDDKSKACLTQAARLRRISVSDYVRTVAVVQARREVQAAREQTSALTPDEQLTFWNALNETPRLTDAQRRLGSTMRSES